MEMETNQDYQNPSSSKPEPSPRKPLLVSDRLKRDEWSEGAVSSLLEAYESKWILRNRAKLKGQDWEDVAKHVSSRANNTKLPKTQTQCKNKIESMKKRYRSESATADASSWPLFSRLDNLLRGTGLSSPMKAIPAASSPGLVLESSPVAQPLLPPPPLPLPQLQGPPTMEIALNSTESNGVEPMVKVSRPLMIKGIYKSVIDYLNQLTFFCLLIYLFLFVSCTIGVMKMPAVCTYDKDFSPTTSNSLSPSMGESRPGLFN